MRQANMGLILIILLSLVILIVVFSLTYFRSTAGSIESKKDRTEEIQNTIDQYQNKSKTNQEIEIVD